jgi:hypothetical protein
MNLGFIAKNKKYYFFNPLFFLMLASFTGELAGEFWGSPVKMNFVLKINWFFQKYRRFL